MLKLKEFGQKLKNGLIVKKAANNIESFTEKTPH